MLPATDGRSAVNAGAARGASTPILQWKDSEPSLPPAGGEIHLWRIPLLAEPGIAADRARLLIDDELDRMGRYRFERDRERFAMCRGALRILLGRYLSIDPRQVRLRYSPKGKPELDQTAGTRHRHDLRFNLSDSSDWALLAITRGDEIGVDIERVRPLPDAEILARDHFSPREYDEYKALPPSEKLAGFFNCWTRKEAWLKATGEGITVPLDRFDVTLVPGQGPRLLRVEGDPDAPARWALYDCVPAQDYVGAIAVKGKPSHRVAMTFRP